MTVERELLERILSSAVRYFPEDDPDAMIAYYDLVRAMGEDS